ncbi:hypothetical protein L7F22_040649 [Adiantum nelumboides]|nr:hypothetical protein [Adiantum nelumboides]
MATRSPSPRLQLGWTGRAGQGTGYRPPSPIICSLHRDWRRKVAIALMRLAIGASFRVVFEQFGCGISTVSTIVDSFVDALLHHMQDFVKWLSTPSEMLAVKAGYQILNGPCFTGRGYSIREYIVGDGGYYQLPWLLIPFQAPLTPTQARYNTRQSSTRAVVERAFGRLKTTWHFLHGTVRQPDINKLPKVIAACCILHNMGIDHGLQVGPEAEDAALQAYHQEENTSYKHLDELHGTVYD